MFRLAGLLILVLSTLVYAEEVPYLLQQMRAAQPSLQAIVKARRQVGEHRDFKLQDISLVPFHLRKKEPINPSKAYCTECHLPLPHQKRLRSRAFLNMHTDYIACETCHYRPRDQHLTHAWYDFKQMQLRKPEPALFHSGRKKDDKLPLVKREGVIKIVPLLNNEVIIATQDHPAAKEHYAQWKQADRETKARLKAQWHTPLLTKGPECTACHIDAEQARMQTKEGQLTRPFLDFTALGANATQKVAIEENTIADFFAHYQPDPPAASADNIETAAQAQESENKKEERIRITNFLH